MGGNGGYMTPSPREHAPATFSVVPNPNG